MLCLLAWSKTRHISRIGWDSLRTFLGYFQPMQRRSVMSGSDPPAQLLDTGGGDARGCKKPSLYIGVSNLDVRWLVYDGGQSFRDLCSRLNQ